MAEFQLHHSMFGKCGRKGRSRTTHEHHSENRTHSLVCLGCQQYYRSIDIRVKECICVARFETLTSRLFMRPDSWPFITLVTGLGYSRQIRLLFTKMKESHRAVFLHSSTHIRTPIFLTVGKLCLCLIGLELAWWLSVVPLECLVKRSTSTMPIRICAISKELKQLLEEITENLTFNLLCLICVWIYVCLQKDAIV